ncbi:Scr1 family TA system antitoxin-like transcriptional regulator [Nocardiopsis sp. CA-288880]|uniref:Scr1 family TA system antitoxin-like transcriptional regulator n=1 Tax=Nocardiopsis sp. CA-288880 TaxID=3239995 RepID=UPI003D99A739
MSRFETGIHPIRRTEVVALLDREQPPVVRVVLDESVLRRQVGSSRIMSAQLQALAAAATRDRVDIRILSYEESAEFITTLSKELR